MRVPLSLTLLAAAICLAAVVGCAPAEAPAPVEPAVPRASLEDTVSEYNRLLAEGFRQMDMGVLEPVSTPEQAEREYVFMAALGESGMRLDSQLVGIEFGEVSGSETTATIETSETWDYRRENTETGELVAEETGVVYELLYTLVRVTADTWVVSGIEPLDEPAEGAETTETP